MGKYFEVRNSSVEKSFNDVIWGGRGLIINDVMLGERRNVPSMKNYTLSSWKPYNS